MVTPFNSQELHLISTRLDQKHSFKGSEMCNYIFGFNNWSSEILELRLYFTTEETSADGKVSYSSGSSAISRLVLRDGSHRDAVGSGDFSGADTKMESIAAAQQAAINEGIQRCVEQFQAGHSHAAHPMLLATQGGIYAANTEGVSFVSTPGISNKTTIATSSTPTAANLSGQKRVFQHDGHSKESNLRTPAAPSAQKSIATPSEVHSSASPTIEDIDSLMQQYDQMHKGADTTSPPSFSAARRAGAINTATNATRNVNNSAHSEALRRSAHLKEACPTHASLKGQKYPPKPNLQDPFGKQK